MNKIIAIIAVVLVFIGMYFLVDNCDTKHMTTTDTSGETIDYVYNEDTSEYDLWEIRYHE